MPGVKAILTADDLPAPHRRRGRACRPEAGAHQRAGLPGRADPGDRRRRRADGGRGARARFASTSSRCRSSSIRSTACVRAAPTRGSKGNAFVGGKLATREVEPARCFAAAGDGALPLGEPGTEWAYGDVEAGFRDAALVLDETFHTHATGHQPLETRSAMAYWQNGTLYLHGSTQSVGADRRERGALGRRRRRQGGRSSASTRAAASAARFPARTRWRFPRCSRRRPARR